jgi:hypothetical protein
MRANKPITVILWIPGLIMLVGLGWLVTRYLVGLRNLGYVDSAIVTTRVLVANENRFSAVHPETGFTCKLADIAGDTNIVNARKNGYLFEIHDCEGPVGSRSATYRLTARPLLPGIPAFCSDQSGILRADYDGSVIKCIRSGQPL